MTEEELTTKLKALLPEREIGSLTSDELSTIRAMIKIYNNLRGVGVVGGWLRSLAIWLAAMAGIWALVVGVFRNGNTGP